MDEEKPLNDYKIPLTVPFFDHEELEMISKCLESGWVTQGPMVSRFEKLFSELHQVQYALATTSCSAALHLATLSLNLGPGDEAIVPAYTWVTSANCVEYTGARAVFADIDLSTFNIDPESIRANITPRTKAIVVVHLFGLSADMDKIMDLAREFNLKVIEDAACAVGCSYDNKPVGGIGDFGCFSFHPRKVITTGEGGMVTTNSSEYAKLINSYRNHGTEGEPPGPGAMPKPYDMSGVPNLGYNLRLSDIQAAVGLAQLSKLANLLKERWGRAQEYNRLLINLDEICIPSIPDKSNHTYQSYVVRLRKGGLERRNKIMEHLAENGIWSRPGTHAVHCLDFYKNKYALRPEQYPNSVVGENETITLPLFHDLSEESMKRVVNELKKGLSNTML